MDKEKIRSLAEDAELKRQYFNALGLCNSHGLSAEDRLKQVGDYEIARAEMYEAEALLRAAVSP